MTGIDAKARFPTPVDPQELPVGGSKQQTMDAPVWERPWPSVPGKDSAVQPKRILVIDRTPDTQAVLQAVLEPAGTVVEHARTLNAAATRLTAAEVVVIDSEESFSDDDCWDDYAGSRVVLGTRTNGRAAPGERFLEKPFEYPDLVRTIRELLDHGA